MRHLICLLAAALLQASLFSATGAAAQVSPHAELQPTFGQTVGNGRPRLDLAGASSSWSGSPAADARRRGLLALLAAERKVDTGGADPASLERRLTAANSAAERAAAQLTLDDAAQAYLVRRNGGQPVPPAATARALRRLALASGGDPLVLALVELEIIQDLGGWHEVGTVPGPLPTVPPTALVSPETDVAPALPKRKQLPEPISLRARLVQSGDLPASELGISEPDALLATAVARFQERHGLAADGEVGARTLATLNAPVAGQIAQVRLNLARTLDDRSQLPRYVVVNVPGFELKVVDHGAVVLRSRVIVGEKDNETPIFDDRIRYIEVNPSWYVPESIVPELLDKEQKKPGYLATAGFQWRGSSEPGAKQRLVQKPGPDNALGRIKFLFPNNHSVYLHDTSQPNLFGRNKRSLSHGCVRVEKPNELALALLGDQGWTLRRLQAAYASRKTQRIGLTEPVPVFLDYRTAFVDAQGRLNLRPDLYGHDRDGITVFEGKGLRPDPEVADGQEVAEPIISPPSGQLVPVATAPRPAS
jgi:hypothetical protein